MARPVRTFMSLAPRPSLGRLVRVNECPEFIKGSGSGSRKGSAPVLALVSSTVDLACAALFAGFAPQDSLCWRTIYPACRVRSWHPTYSGTHYARSHLYSRLRSHTPGVGLYLLRHVIAMGQMNSNQRASLDAAFAFSLDLRSLSRRAFSTLSQVFLKTMINARPKSLRLI